MKNLLEFLEASAPIYKDKIALADDTSSLSFPELLRFARAGGSALAQRGLIRCPVAVLMNKTPQAVAAFFAVMYAGGCYVPLDEGMPAFRLRAIFEKLRPRAVICSGETRRSAEAFAPQGCELLDAEELFSAREDGELLSRIRERAIDTDPAYIVFTSGSTGVPKGVTGCHRALIDYANALLPVIGADDNSVFAMQVPLFVDACMKELLSVICRGATAYLMPQGLFMSPLRAVEYLNGYKINSICWVASALSLISGLGAFDEARPEYLRLVCFGSEVFPARQLRLWREACPGARFINLYGPTEATGMSFYYEVCRDFPDDEPIPVGRPFDNTDFFLLRGDDTEAAPGETGEICIRGTALTLGYYDDPERTAAAFTQNPLNRHYPELIYRTGDLGRLNARGELVFVSRKDRQIKSMGHRIELGEIEACAVSREGVVSACCMLDKKGKIRLVYMGACGEKELRRQLREQLPRYMLPGVIVRLDEMPLLPNGKIDRNKLMNMEM